MKSEAKMEKGRLQTLKSRTNSHEQKEKGEGNGSDFRIPVMVKRN
jgi:hypothetical protein